MTALLPADPAIDSASELTPELQEAIGRLLEDHGEEAPTETTGDDLILLRHAVRRGVVRQNSELTPEFRAACWRVAAYGAAVADWMAHDDDDESGSDAKINIIVAARNAITEADYALFRAAAKGGGNE